jgi:UDP-N-acetylmuramate dehydrogenase
MSFYEDLNKAGIQIEEGKDLTSFSTMRLRSTGDLIVLKSVEEIVTFQKLAKSNQQAFGILGWGANQPLPERSTVPYIKLQLEFDKKIFDDVRDEYSLPASVSLATLTSAASRLCLSGWEVLSGIPASVGGAIAMNAGTALGEIAKLVVRVGLCDEDGNLKSLELCEKDFSYRRNNFLKKTDIIYQVTLKHYGVDKEVSTKIKNYLQYRNKTQPMNAWTCGCMFKNSVSEQKICRAGEYIDIMGLKGLRFKNLRISPVHANFLENLGDSTLEDVREFIRFIRGQLKGQFGIEFEPEIKI